MCGHKMPVSGEESETEDMASENGESAAPEDGAQELAFKNKYKELKNKLKYLVYVSRANSVYVCQMFDLFSRQLLTGTRVLRAGTAQSRANTIGANQG